MSKPRFSQYAFRIWSSVHHVFTMSFHLKINPTIISRAMIKVIDFTREIKEIHHNSRQRKLSITILLEQSSCVNSIDSIEFVDDGVIGTILIHSFSNFGVEQNRLRTLTKSQDLNRSDCCHFFGREKKKSFLPPSQNLRRKIGLKRFTISSDAR
jgi:hypothetical protein